MDIVHATNILIDSLTNLEKRQGTIYIPDLEADVINNACLALFKTGKSIDMNSIEYATAFADAAIKLFPEYDESHKSACLMSVNQNMSWPGMRTFLKNYFIEKHGRVVVL